MPRILTVGHGTLAADVFVSLLDAAGVTAVVDVRSHPGSRHNPQYGSTRLARWLPDAGIAYRWVQSLGGRRRGVPDSPHVALRHPSFRAYADHMGTDVFRSGVEALLALDGLPVVMCSESVWWRCHRRLLSDHLALVDGVDVGHLMHDGRIVPHPPTDGVRVAGGGLVYDLTD